MTVLIIVDVVCRPTTIIPYLLLTTNVIRRVTWHQTFIVINGPLVTRGPGDNPNHQSLLRYPSCVTITPLTSKHGITLIVQAAVRVVVDKNSILSWTMNQLLWDGHHRQTLTITTSPLPPTLAIAQVFPILIRAVMVLRSGTRPGGHSVRHHHLLYLDHKANPTRLPNHRLVRQWTIVEWGPGINTKARDLRVVVIRRLDGIITQRKPVDRVLICLFPMRYLKAHGNIRQDNKKCFRVITLVKNLGEKHTSARQVLM